MRLFRERGTSKPEMAAGRLNPCRRGQPSQLVQEVEEEREVVVRLVRRRGEREAFTVGSNMRFGPLPKGEGVEQSPRRSVMLTARRP